MSLESFFQTESGKDEKEAYGKSYEERIKRKFCQRGGDSGNGTSRHGEHRPVRIEMAWPENSKRERQKDASSSESHGKIIPEKYLRPPVHDGDKGCQNHDGKDSQLCQAEKLSVISNFQQRRKNIMGNHSTDTQRQSPDTSQ